MDEELKEQEVHDGRPKDATPESRMRPGEGSIGEGEDGDDEEEDGHPDQPTVDVAVDVSSLIPEEDRGELHRHVFYLKTTNV